MYTTAKNRPVSEPTDMHEMIVVHRVFRRELRSIPDLIVRTRPGDLARATVVAGHARLILSGLHLHHTSEDDLLWPLMLERSAPAVGVVERMQNQHTAVDTQSEQLGTVLARWEAEARPAVAKEAAELMDRLCAVVVEHLDDEEQHILPTAGSIITADEWAAVGKAGVAKMSRAEIPLMFGAVLEDASASERQLMLKSLPLPAKVLMRAWGYGHYRRYITAVRDGR